MFSHPNLPFSLLKFLPKFPVKWCMHRWAFRKIPRVPFALFCRGSISDSEVKLEAPTTNPPWLQQLGVFGFPPTHRNFNGLSSRNMFSHPNLLFSLLKFLPKFSVKWCMYRWAFEKFLVFLLLCSVVAPLE
ncbi:hypothetical protein CDAR_85131 [Caerostris darwini]|uniref:Uncharacterized protein n=1 Tax=Caerostris darwini TaxID=1538125 RepID=A0AAV4MZG5_9ARAC|nr:hypothetical protein CDAR_85131 [Caerostris darwini]